MGGVPLVADWVARVGSEWFYVGTSTVSGIVTNVLDAAFLDVIGVVGRRHGILELLVVADSAWEIEKKTGKAAFYRSRGCGYHGKLGKSGPCVERFSGS